MFFVLIVFLFTKFSKELQSRGPNNCQHVAKLLLELTFEEVPTQVKHTLSTRHTHDMYQTIDMAYVP